MFEVSAERLTNPAPRSIFKTIPVRIVNYLILIEEPFVPPCQTGFNSESSQVLPLSGCWFYLTLFEPLSV